ncbi:AAWKG family protein [Streptomyces bobili]|uniref:AAWKG family protein n=1 Tax=Streptomyces bobili TaxID=67280 RepID=UPI00343000B9
MAIDNWEHILALLTGWTLPDRSAVTSAKGDGGIPWMNVTIKKRGLGDPTNVLREDGATFQFYAGSGKNLSMYQADVSYADISLGKVFWTRTGNALEHMLYDFSTVNVSDPYGGAPSATNGVDLHEFSRIAAAFDVAGDFFQLRTEILKQWLESLGQEQAAWKGTAASVFYDLIDDLRAKYEHFTSELRPPGFTSANHSVANPGYQPTTLHADDLIGAERNLYKAYEKLYETYRNFYWRNGEAVSYAQADGSTGSGKLAADPRDILNEMMVDIAQWITVHNWSNVRYGLHQELTGNPGGPSYRSYEDWTAVDGFSSTVTWGNLQDTSTWSAVANEAVNRWTRNVQTNLDTPALPVVNELQRDWSRVLDPSWNPRFAFSDLTSTSLGQKYQTDQQEAQQAKLQQQADESQRRLADQTKSMGDGLDGLSKNMGDFGRNMGDFGDELNGDLTSASGNLGSLGSLGTNLQGSGSDLGRNLSGSIGSLGSSLLSGGPTQTGVDLPVGSYQGPTDSRTPAGVSEGGVTTRLPDGSSFTANPGGSITTTDPGGTRTTRFPNGLTQTLTPTGSLSMSQPDGSTTVRNPDGSVTTRLPDGSSRVVNPDGSVVTTLPDGSSSTSRLVPGGTLTNPDGSTLSLGGDGGVTTRLPDGSSFTANPGGSITTTDPGGMRTTRFPNGLTQTLTPTGSLSMSQPDGSTTVRNPDGSVTTRLPDGSSRVVNPDGSVVTTLPDGSSSTSRLVPGGTLTNPDGSTLSLGGDGGVTTRLPDGSSFTANPDGSITTTDPDGAQTTQYPNGVVQTHTPDGHVQLTSPDGSVTVQNPDGSETTTFPDGSVSTLRPDGSVTTTTPSGQTISSHLDPGQGLVNPDGSTTTVSRDGSFVTRSPDGSSVTLHPDGTVTTTNPSGTGTSDLTQAAQLPTSSGPLSPTGTNLGGALSDLGHTLTTQTPDGSITSHFPSGASATTTPDGFTTTRFPDGSSTVAGPNGEFQALPSPSAVAEASEPAAAEAFEPVGSGIDGDTAEGAAASGVPRAGTGADAGLGAMLSPMMMMMGMGRMANQGGGQGGNQGERVRDVYEDADGDGAFIGHQRTPQQVAPAEEAFEEEEEDVENLLARSATETGGRIRPATQSSHPAWAEDEGDVWGTEEGGLPASIGR